MDDFVRSSHERMFTSEQGGTHASFQAIFPVRLHPRRAHDRRGDHRHPGGLGHLRRPPLSRERQDERGLARASSSSPSPLRSPSRRSAALPRRTTTSTSPATGTTTGRTKGKRRNDATARGPWGEARGAPARHGGSRPHGHHRHWRGSSLPALHVFKAMQFLMSTGAPHPGFPGAS